MRKILPVLLLLSIISCKKEEEGTVIARVGQSVLTLEEFHSGMPVEFRMRLSLEDKRHLVENWINTELLYEKAKREGILKEPEMVAQLEQLKRQVVVNYWLSRHTFEGVFVSWEEVRDYYERNRARYDNEIEIAHIVTPTLLAAEEIERRLKQGEDFGKLAREYSIDPSSERSGVIGYIRFGDIGLPGFESTAFSLENKGDISAIIQTMQGFHIIKLLGRRKLEDPVKLEDVGEIIREQLLIEKQTTLIDSLIEQLREEIPVQTHYESLR
ncbi:peptidylprolyl isomerase [candidate division WOR-3 bacterium]|nr:peptidylprolyl isomerase [candidate division WOR-3 bacterium]